MNWLKRSGAAVFAAMILTTSVVVCDVNVAAANETCETGFGDSIPLVQIHGLNSDREIWDSMGGRLETVNDDVFPVRFDYRQVHNEWVTHEDIGPKLARYIDCLAQASLDGGGNGKVILLAHSMGGLAARYAMSQEIDGRLVADAVDLVIPIATPHLGSDMAKLCEWLRLMPQCHGSAPLAMKPGSEELASLPQFPDSVPVQAIAGDVTIHDKLFNADYTLDLNSDVVVGTDSASAVYGEPAVDNADVFECDGQFSRFLDVVMGVEASCEHTAMLSTSYVQDSVVSIIEAYLASQMVEKIDFYGLQLPIDEEDWMIVYPEDGTNWAYTDDVHAIIVDRECAENDEYDRSYARMFCQGFSIINMNEPGYEDWMPYDPEYDCHTDHLHDNYSLSGPRDPEDVTIGGVEAIHQEHWLCEHDDSWTPVLPEEKPNWISHSWLIPGEGLLVFDFYNDGPEPLPGLEELLDGASWS